MEINELNKNANGGTELMLRRLHSLFDEDYLKQFQIIPSRVRDIDPNRKAILYLHDLPGDPEVQHLKNDGWRDYDMLVFVSHWQQQQYNNILGVPFEAGVVIENAIEEMEPKRDKTDTTIRLIYTSTPHRGLELLLPAFQYLKTQHKNIELDVYSSFSLYGWPQRDEPYKELFEALQTEKHINYHGAKSNEEVREALSKADIFAYPSIWQETSCLCLIEAMSAGLICVHPSLGALPETSGGITNMYSYVEDHQTHAVVFTNVLSNIIRNIRTVNKRRLNGLPKKYADQKYSIDRYKCQWNFVLESLL